MFSELLKIAGFILQSIIHVWPYLLISVPIAAAVRMSGASKYIGKAFNKSPLVSILLASVLGAFSPFCSCSVIPVIASLLIGGVPLAPVMSFWLASPSMDPEIFFLSVSVLGWQLAVWRLASAFGMSFISGLITHYLVKRKWITEAETLKAYAYSPVKSNRQIIKEYFVRVKEKYFAPGNTLAFAAKGIPVIRGEYHSGEGASQTGAENRILNTKYDCCGSRPVKTEKNEINKSSCCGSNPSEQRKETAGCGCGTEIKEPTVISFRKKLSGEILSAASMVLKFMILAYFLEALIVLYVPDDYLTPLLGGNGFVSIIIAAVIGIPVYTSSMPALALTAGLITKGMAPAAGLAFLLSGPTTTIPAMAAVWSLASRKVFFLYIAFTLGFALISGFIYYAVYAII